MAKTYLFTVGPATPPAMTIDPGTEIAVTVDGAFDDIEDIALVPTPFTPASEGHPLAPVTGPIAVRGARPGTRSRSTCSRSSPSAKAPTPCCVISACSGRSSATRRSSPARSAMARRGSQTAWRSRSRPISVRCRPCRPRATGPPTPALTAATSISATWAWAPGSTCRCWSTTRWSSWPTPRGNQRRHHQRHRGRVLGAGAGAHRAGQGKPGGAADLRAGRHGADRGLRPLGGGGDRGRLRGRGRAWSRAGPGSRGARPTCCSASSASSASAPRPGPPWRRG